ncbi:excise [Mycobacterium phage LilSpotty]|uniref:Excise n=1 Tax=Mycobacterium phage LilSpotty TaxID=2588512 RepID=A0A4Y6EM50_9CAUD|nr:excise [Mycobacterium phage LilSpotty]QDF19780.1 excise [Mycobacterium phage LilSpotty]
MKLHRIDHVISAWGIGQDMKDPIGWMKRRIHDGTVRARKIGRHWYMTDDDIRDALQAFSSTRPEPAPVIEEAPQIHRAGLSAASSRRRSA